MGFGELHPFPERGSPTRLSASGQESYEGLLCRPSMMLGFKFLLLPEQRNSEFIAPTNAFTTIWCTKASS
jgi:hypothetical protein